LKKIFSFTKPIEINYQVLKKGIDID